MATTTSTTRTKKPAQVTPTANKTELNHRMTVEKGVVDELLLVCGVIGTTTNNRNELVPVTDCINWLQDLQRALRRDDDAFRPISLLMGKWKVVQQKLLPLVLTCRYDNAMVLTIVKILVILTKPLSDRTVNAARRVVDTKNKKLSEATIKEQIKFRENAIAQAEMLMEYKKAITHHASHNRKRAQQSSQEEGGLLSIFVSLLAEPLAKTGTSRSDVDHLTIELVLHLFRNLLSAETLSTSGSMSRQDSLKVHHELIHLFQSELVFEILFVIAQEMESRENANYNLLMMEIFHHLLKDQDPTAVARSMNVPKAVAPSSSTSSKKKQKGKENNNSNKGGSRYGLREALQRDKQRFSHIRSARHSNFGGTLVMNRKDGSRQYLSAGLATNSTNGDPLPANLVKKRKNRKREPFVLAAGTMAHTRGSSTDGVPLSGPIVLRAQQSLHHFCQRFMTDCYGPMMKSLKNEFRRDSVRLEEGDKTTFYQLVWFFCQWHRMSRGSNGGKQKPLGHLIFTMDVFTFNLVLNSTDHLIQHKLYPGLQQTVALYSEMMFLLSDMYNSKDETEHIMALGLMDRLFYCGDPVDRLPRLLARWVPGTTTREYLCDLVELVHVTLKLLEANAKASGRLGENAKPDRSKKNKKKQHQQVRDKVARMNEEAADFDVVSYTMRKLVSNQIVNMYAHLFSQYAVNSATVNHHVVAYFLRISKLKVVVAEDGGAADSAPKNPLAVKTTTLEPMTYTIQMVQVLNQILNDHLIRKEKEFSVVLAFAVRWMKNFAAVAQANPMVYVEALFRHNVPHRFCEMATNMYVSEELRMLAEREMLLEENAKMEAEEVAKNRRAREQSAGRRQRHDYVSDEEDEVEWDDVVQPKEAAIAPSKTKDESKLASDEEEDELSVAPPTGKDNARSSKQGKKANMLEDTDDEDDASEGRPASGRKHNLAEDESDVSEERKRQKTPPDDDTDDEIKFKAISKPRLSHGLYDTDEDDE